MNKNKKNENLSNLIQTLKSQLTVRNVLIIILFLILFVLALGLAWKRFREVNVTSEPTITIQKPTFLTQADLQPILDRLTALEAKVTQQQQPIQPPLKLVALALLKGVLEGYIPLDSVKAYLQRNPDPWAQNYFNSLAPLKAGTTYEQLESLLTFPPQPAPPSMWQYLKDKIKSIIYVRKLDKKGNEPGPLDDVYQAVTSQNVQKALESYEKLAPDQKTQLANWLSLAQDRLALENLVKRLLQELSES